jgi:hypothetical protein
MHFVAATRIRNRNMFIGNKYTGPLALLAVNSLNPMANWHPRTVTCCGSHYRFHNYSQCNHYFHEHTKTSRDFPSHAGRYRCGGFIFGHLPLTQFLGTEFTSDISACE